MAADKVLPLEVGQPRRLSLDQRSDMARGNHARW